MGRCSHEVWTRTDLCDAQHGDGQNGISSASLLLSPPHSSSLSPHSSLLPSLLSSHPLFPLLSLPHSLLPFLSSPLPSLFLFSSFLSSSTLSSPFLFPLSCPLSFSLLSSYFSSSTGGVLSPCYPLCPLPYWFTSWISSSNRRSCSSELSSRRGKVASTLALDEHNDMIA